MTDQLKQHLKLAAPEEHASYAGHFPGNAVVPGVLLLDMVVEAVALGPPRAVDQVKFQRALKPGESFDLAWSADGDQVNFRCERGGQLLAAGRLSFGRHT
jgi:3-hydroxymyristoyl/3-hydroxydecanoyl-(acyl carrier protein) dehydratase